MHPSVFLRFSSRLVTLTFFWASPTQRFRSSSGHVTSSGKRSIPVKNGLDGSSPSFRRWTKEGSTKRLKDSITGEPKLSEHYD
jgi:hypothetical protein